MPEHPYCIGALEERYGRICKAGAQFWEKPIPADSLAKSVSNTDSRRA